MSMNNSIALLASAGGDYQISRSVRVRSSAAAYFNRTLGTATSNTIWSLSMWVKRGTLSNSNSYLIEAYTNGTNRTPIAFTSANALQMYYLSGGSLIWQLATTPVFRDPSAWYHVVVNFNSNLATASDRVQMYVNGARITAFSTASYPSLGQATQMNLGSASSVVHYLGAEPGTPAYLDGYLTEINFIDGQALTPASFGETDAVTGVWKPKKYTGTYGSNGFYLNFSDNSAATAAAIGKDYSGNGNNWTPNNISVTAGVTYDSMIDVPTPWADGGNGRGNYSVINPIAGFASMTVSDGNLKASPTLNTGWHSKSGTMSASAGKWYAEFSMASITSGAQGNPAGFGITPSNTEFTAIGQMVGDSGRGYAFYCPDTAGSAPLKRVAGSSTSVGTGSATATTDVFMVAFDLTNGNAWFGKNGSWYAGDPSAGTSASITGIAAGEYVFGLSVYRDNTFTNNTLAVNFGQRPFAYTPPTGFKALNTQNLPTPTILKGDSYFNTVLYTGNGTGQTVSGVGFQPDFVWGKSRNQIRNHNLYDAVRGVGNMLFTNGTNAELTGGELTAFTSDGFTLGSNVYQMNASGDSMVAWNWKANGAAVTNTAGSITSQVSAGVAQGFSIVTYTGTGANATVGHGLGVAPKMIIIKQRNNTVARGWPVYHVAIGNTKYLNLESTAATVINSNRWGNTTPTSSVFTIGSSAEVNESGKNFVAYSFSEVEGFSKFGSYTGNGSADGPFVYLGFRPAFLMVKRTDTTGDWTIWDIGRNPGNLTYLRLSPNLSAIEATTSLGTNSIVDLLSNGFKYRGSNAATNASAGTYIYMAFAENPFKYSLAR